MFRFSVCSHFEKMGVYFDDLCTHDIVDRTNLEIGGAGGFQCDGPEDGRLFCKHRTQDAGMHFVFELI